MSLRILMASLCVAGFALAPLSADAAKTPFKRDLSKEFEDLTPSEQIAIRAAAKAAYKAKKLGTLNVCADPGNMPLLQRSRVRGSRTRSPMCSVRRWAPR